MFIEEEQNGFRKGRSCIDAVFTMEQVTEKRLLQKLETRIPFNDYTKAFGTVLRHMMWGILEERVIKVILFKL